MYCLCSFIDLVENLQIIPCFSFVPKRKVKMIFWLGMDRNGSDAAIFN